MNSIPAIKTIRGIIENRGISVLIHFTPNNCLKSILEVGEIISRRELDHHPGLPPFCKDYITYNDSIRLDQHPECINLSVQHPNYFLLTTFQNYWRQKEPGLDIIWCMLKINPEILFDREDVLFTTGNAAATSVRYNGTGNTAGHFEALFGEQVPISGGKTQTRELQLGPAYPTSIQAEILYPQGIPASQIMAICVQSEERKRTLINRLEILLEDVIFQKYREKIHVEPNLFTKERL